MALDEPYLSKERGQVKNIWRRKAYEVLMTIKPTLAPILPQGSQS